MITRHSLRTLMLRAWRIRRANGVTMSQAMRAAWSSLKAAIKLAVKAPRMVRPVVQTVASRIVCQPRQPWSDAAILQAHRIAAAVLVASGLLTMIAAFAWHDIRGGF